LSFLAALRFLTTLRVPQRGGGSPEDLAGSTGLFPVVGIIIGLILAGAYWLLIHILPPAVVSGILIVASVVLSGGLHLDGFVDTCDGIGGHKDAQARWKVMHDSRSGAFGIIGVICLLLLKYASLNSVPDNLMMAALLIMPVISRWTMVYAIFAYPYARPSGLGKVIKQGVQGHQAGGRPGPVCPDHGDNRDGGNRAGRLGRYSAFLSGRPADNAGGLADYPGDGVLSQGQVRRSHR